jgi:hypothetical protein
MGEIRAIKVDGVTWIAFLEIQLRRFYDPSSFGEAQPDERLAYLVFHSSTSSLIAPVPPLGQSIWSYSEEELRSLFDEAKARRRPSRTDDWRL